MRGALPDPRCTPGAVYPAVTQATIHQTICVRGWTATIRPPLTWTEPLKRRLMTAYGIPKPTSMTGFEFDHLVPLELGGAPADVANLWPEPGASPNAKDAVERAANRAVCAGKVALAAARQGIARDWQAFGRQLASTTPPNAQGG